MTINPDELAETIKKTLEEWKDVTEEGMAKGIDITAKEALSELHHAHPAGSGEYGSWNDYNSGWTVMKTKRDKTVTGQIHNATHYQLTHLLEKGHALKNGGRTRAFVHIAPVAERCQDDLLDNIKKQI